MHKIFLQNLYITLLLPTVANMLRSSVPSGTLWLNCTANIGCLWSSCYIHTRKKSSWQNPWILNLHVIKYNNVTSLAIVTKQIVQEIMEATSISWCPKFKYNLNLINLNYPTMTKVTTWNKLVYRHTRLSEIYLSFQDVTCPSRHICGHTMSYLNLLFIHSQKTATHHLILIW